jgi:hypothetical protein
LVRACIYRAWVLFAFTLSTLGLITRLIRANIYRTRRIFFLSFALGACRLITRLIRANIYRAGLFLSFALGACGLIPRLIRTYIHWTWGRIGVGVGVYNNRTLRRVGLLARFIGTDILLIILSLDLRTCGLIGSGGVI